MADEEVEAVPETEAEENAPVEEAEEVEKAAEPKEQEEAVEEDILDETEEDPFELLDEESEDNEEEKLMYREYLDLMKQIDCQNEVINDIKQRSMVLKELPCKTLKDVAEYKRLRICLDQEKLKLHTMMNRAIQLQNNGSKRVYSSIELAMTGFENNMLINPSGCWSETKGFASSSRKPKTAQAICDALDNSDTDSDDCGCSGRY